MMGMVVETVANEYPAPETISLHYDLACSFAASQEEQKIGTVLALGRGGPGPILAAPASSLQSLLRSVLRYGRRTKDTAMSYKALL
ncbi:hypothetical protein N7462_005532 [Penicillium macrosclerotiorum]|uniref:uncharacterized protein n=1 Tax=Penicillium macrosclerotiorum TaxID=303699 RepID=UPI0025478EDA|nr:uncharacterized protein N7462_005532 [Penicillium macrosclerotiorum]KAJ5682367.1 hypothetical protein N7462_005532 [Penicillium macrosclerotiorum]